MGISFLESQTRANLMRAFAGESQARNRYTFAAEKAKQAKLEVVQAIFLMTADQELAHAKVFYDFLKPCNGQTIEVDGTYPVDQDDKVLNLLKTAVHNESQEHQVDYPAFARTAKEEGFDQIQRAFEMIAGVEATHAQRFQHFAQLMEEGKLFVSDVETGWMCLNCGMIVHSTMAPAQCPVCKHGQGYFVRLELAPYLPGK